MTKLSGGGRRRIIALVVAVVLAAGGIAAIVLGMGDQQEAPRPPASAAQQQPGASASGMPAPAPAGGSSDSARGPTLPASEPTRIDIPAIDVHHGLIKLGQNPDGTVQVPSLDDVAVPGWSTISPTPGQQGPAVITGHVDSAEQGEGVFFDLGNLRPGDTFTIDRADHTTAVFRITGVDEYAKDAFPTLKVYGNTQRAEARLITCGGRFDSETGDYIDNIVVYAQLVDSHPVRTP